MPNHLSNDPRRRACRVLGLRADKWPTDWPLPTGAQLCLLRSLLRARPSSFVGAVDPATRIYRVIVFNDVGPERRRHPIAREYALLPDGRMRRAQVGVPYTEEETRAA
jgi:hypothetical protein